MVKHEQRAGRRPARFALEAPPSARTPTLNDRFRHFALQVGTVLGSPWAFLLACVFVAVWALTGPYFHYSNAWQLVINTSTTIATFLMVFLLQATQNRDTKAINIKLDELLRAIEGARTGLANLHELTDEEVEHLERELVNLARKAGVDPLSGERGSKPANS